MEMGSGRSGLDLWSGMAGNNPKVGVCWFRAESADRLLLFYQEIGLGGNHASTGVKPQTAMPKMTAGTVRSFHVFIKNYDLRWYFAVELVFSWKTTIAETLYGCLITSCLHVP